jgi:hypothetical protein
MKYIIYINIIDLFHFISVDPVTGLLAGLPLPVDTASLPLIG